MANEPNEPAKSEVQDPREMVPVDSRETMWRAVKLYAALAGMLLAAWGLLLLTAWVYRQPPPCPPIPLQQVFWELKRGMSEDEVCAIMGKYDPFARKTGSGKWETRFEVINDEEYWWPSNDDSPRVSRMHRCKRMVGR
ncbi:MAG: hypothetical protein HYV25_03625, partial [Candidatus Harrisonbacteria bacterium]|nr:hypothetical protein [Candidatus Harrisonbacteria bacterium]